MLQIVRHSFAWLRGVRVGATVRQMLLLLLMDRLRRGGDGECSVLDIFETTLELLTYANG